MSSSCRGLHVPSITWNMKYRGTSDTRLTRTFFSRWLTIGSTRGAKTSFTTSRMLLYFFRGRPPAVLASRYPLTYLAGSTLGSIFIFFTLVVRGLRSGIAKKKP